MPIVKSLIVRMCSAPIAAGSRREPPTHSITGQQSLLTIIMDPNRQPARPEPQAGMRLKIQKATSSTLLLPALFQE